MERCAEGIWEGGRRESPGGWGGLIGCVPEEGRWRRATNQGVLRTHVSHMYQFLLFWVVTCPCSAPNRVETDGTRGSRSGQVARTKK